MATLTICTIELIAKAPPKKGYPVNPTIYGEHLRKARMDLKLTQKELAIMLEVYTSTINKWERRGVTPKGNNRIKIIEIMNTMCI